jgi:hypothetical protein
MNTKVDGGCPEDFGSDTGSAPYLCSSGAARGNYGCSDPLEDHSMEHD